MPNLDKLRDHLSRRGYDVTIFDTQEEAGDYLNEKIDHRSVGVTGSVTLQKLDLAERLSRHNMVQWHWYNYVDPTESINSQVFMTSVNAVTEDGVIVVVDGRGNRAAGMMYGHEELYIVIGTNKIVSTYEEAVDRAWNYCAPTNVTRMHGITNGKHFNLPCVSDPEHKCQDCTDPDRVCRIQLDLHMRPNFIKRAEIIIIKEELGI